jgi:hypothetical protein
MIQTQNDQNLDVAGNLENYPGAAGTLALHLALTKNPVSFALHHEKQDPHGHQTP